MDHIHQQHLLKLKDNDIPFNLFHSEILAIPDGENYYKNLICCQVIKNEISQMSYTVNKDFSLCNIVSLLMS